MAPQLIPHERKIPLSYRTLEIRPTSLRTVKDTSSHAG